MDELFDLFDGPDFKPPVFEKKVITLLDDMTSTEFDSYFLNNFLNFLALKPYASYFFF